MPKSSQIEGEIDALYDLRPGEFVPARDALAKRVRREGDRQAADAIKALPRPSAAAWAINQLARREPEWMQALTNAGRRLAEAHEGLLERGERDAWRQAATDARDAIDRMLKLAEGLLRDERGSVSAGLREQVRETLQAATLDPDAREAVTAGRLSRELRPPGGLPDIATGRFKRPATPAAARSAAARPERDGRFARPSGAVAQREARAARRAAERDARAQLRRVERERTAAQAAAQRAEQALVRAAKASEAAASELESARQADAERTAELNAAQAAHAEAETALADQDAAVARARAQLEGVASHSGTADED